jgi:hypothetical protein
MPRRFASWLIVILAFTDLRAALALPVRFDLVAHAGAYRVDATADLAAAQVVVWQTLTDYESLPGFMPGIRRVKVLSRTSEGGRERLRVEQSGEVRVLFYTQRIGVLLDIVHEPQARIDTRALPRPGHPDDAGVKSFEATYSLQPIASGVRLGYRARIVPDFGVPPFIGAWLVHRTLRAQFDAMLAEIERRRVAGPGPRR